MAIIRSYTTIEQSRKLAEFLPLESADMWYPDSEDRNEIECGFDATRQQMYIDYKDGLPCWSLSALVDVLPNGIVINKDAGNGKYHVSSAHIGTYVKEDNLVDACVAMIEKLNELKYCNHGSK